MNVVQQVKGWLDEDLIPYESIKVDRKEGLLDIVSGDGTQFFLPLSTISGERESIRSLRSALVRFGGEALSNANALLAQRIEKEWEAL